MSLMSQGVCPLNISDILIKHIPLNTQFEISYNLILSYINYYVGSITQDIGYFVKPNYIKPVNE